MFFYCNNHLHTMVLYNVEIVIHFSNNMQARYRGKFTNRHTIKGSRCNNFLSFKFLPDTAVLHSHIILLLIVGILFCFNKCLLIVIKYCDSFVSDSSTHLFTLNNRTHHHIRQITSSYLRCFISDSSHSQQSYN